MLSEIRNCHEGFKFVKGTKVNSMVIVVHNPYRYTPITRQDNDCKSLVLVWA